MAVVSFTAYDDVYLTEHLPVLVLSFLSQQNMWHLYGKCYDLTAFLTEHPGGMDALEAARGLPDATALFESYHQSLPRSTLEK